MKNLIKPLKIVKYIDILVSIDDYIHEEESIAAAIHRANTFHPSIKKRRKISDEALALYTNFLNGVLKTMDELL